MLARIARRLVLSIPVCFAASILVFFLLEIAPGDPVQYLGDPDASIDAAREQVKTFGLYDPMPVRLSRWILNTCTLDFGRSILDHRPVREKLFESLPNTLVLSGVSLVFGFLLGIGLAVASVWKKRGALDLCISAFGVAAASLPLFWVGAWAIGWLSIEWGWLPPGGALSVESMLTPGLHLSDRLYHFILPASILTIATAAGVARYARAALAATLEEEFIQSARARGASRARVVLVHALPASLHSTIALFGLSIPWLFGGSVIIEHVFNYPGTGRLLIEAMSRRDYPTVCAGIIVISILSILGNAVAEAAAMRLDPRVEDAANVYME